MYIFKICTKTVKNYLLVNMNKIKKTVYFFINIKVLDLIEVLYFRYINFTFNYDIYSKIQIWCQKKP